jgi:hypothetical protein
MDNAATAPKLAPRRADQEIVLAQRRVNTALSLKRVPIENNRQVLRLCCVRRDRANMRADGRNEVSKASASGYALFGHMTLR